MNLSEQNEAIAKAWFAAFNAHNLQKLLALYDEDAIHFSPKLKIRHPETNGFIKGKSALLTWWQDAFDRLPELKYIPQTLTANRERVFMEYLRQISTEPDLNVAEVLEIKNGKITSSKVYHG